jgi:F0F1-type ATP synthase assembly protein I
VPFATRKTRKLRGFFVPGAGGGAVAGPGERERGADSKKGLSPLAEGYQKASPYIAASTSLVIAVGVFMGVGIWADRKLGNEVPWLTMLGALIGMTGGFISFFRQVLGTRKKKEP